MWLSSPRNTIGQSVQFRRTLPLSSICRSYTIRISVQALCAAYDFLFIFCARESEWPEHTRTTLRDSTPNPSTSVTFLVCNRPQQQARPLHSFFVFCFVFLRQQTPTCFRDRVSFLPTECASVRCHKLQHRWQISKSCRQLPTEYWTV